jgi:hypothetical protein
MGLLGVSEQGPRRDIQGGDEGGLKMNIMDYIGVLSFWDYVWVFPIIGLTIAKRYTLASFALLIVWHGFVTK